MKLELINKIISDYDTLIEVTKNVIVEMGKIDPHYSTERGVEEITFEDGFVHVVCDTTCYGCYEQKHFSFPITFLTLELGDLIFIVDKEKLEREELIRKGKEERERSSKDQKEKNEYNTFLTLRSKFKL